ncbi:NAD(P)-binding domain-containing protein, partial [candidate division KSB1 bacterium]|nr:NAD(P)-binding domain-containing protein [candidate division KSB1 bacterium]
MKFYYDDDADISLLNGKTIGIIGFGNQGRAHALNLRDSGLNVVVGLRPGSKSQKTVENEKIRTESIEKTAELSDIIFLLIPDELQAEVYKSSIEPYLKPGNVLGFAHG